MDYAPIREVPFTARDGQPVWGRNWSMWHNKLTKTVSELEDAVKRMGNDSADIDQIQQSIITTVTEVAQTIVNDIVEENFTTIIENTVNEYFEVNPPYDDTALWQAIHTIWGSEAIYDNTEYSIFAIWEALALLHNYDDTALWAAISEIWEWAAATDARLDDDEHGGDYSIENLQLMMWNLTRDGGILDEMQDDIDSNYDRLNGSGQTESIEGMRTRLAALENAGYQNATQVSGAVATAIGPITDRLDDEDHGGENSIENMRTKLWNILRDDGYLDDLQDQIDELSEAGYATTSYVDGVISGFVTGSQLSEAIGNAGHVSNETFGQHIMDQGLALQAIWDRISAIQIYIGYYG